MNFFKRATTSIVRRPGKSVILLLLVFILGSVIAGAISVEGAISNTDANLRRQMQPLATITSDWEAFEELPEVQLFRERTNELSMHVTEWEHDTWPNIVAQVEEELGMPEPTMGRLLPEHIRALRDLPMVASADYVARTSIQTFDFNRYSGPHIWESDHMEWFELHGTSSTSLVQVEAGNIEIVQGGMFTDSMLVPGSDTSHVIVSSAWAERNNVGLGSIVNLHNVIIDADEFGETWCHGPRCDERIFAMAGMDFEIIGLYNLVGYVQEDNDWQMVERQNTLFVPNWTIEDLERRVVIANAQMWEASDYEPAWGGMPSLDDIDDMEFGQWITSLIMLNDPDDVEAFEEAIKPLMPSEFWIPEFRSGGFDDISSSMETMQNIANWILYVSVGATLLILSLLITLFLRDRRYEMGVYLAIGEKKGRIVSQILLEVVATSFVSITLAVFVGHFISGQISSNMLENNLLAQQDEVDPWGGWGGWDIFESIGVPSQEMTIDEMLEAFDVSLSIQTIGLFYAVGLGAVIVSSLIPVMYVVTLNPKKVLM